MPTIILRRPVITEKSLLEVQEKIIYMFEVNPRANKHQVRAAVQELFGVEVESVRTMMKPGRIKRSGKKRIQRYTSAQKRALVQVKQGQKIQAFDVINKS